MLEKYNEIWQKAICYALCYSSSLSTLVLQNLHLIRAAMMSSQTAKQLLYADRSHIIYIYITQITQESLALKHTALFQERTDPTLIRLFMYFSKLFIWAVIYRTSVTDISRSVEVVPSVQR